MGDFEAGGEEASGIAELGDWGAWKVNGVEWQAEASEIVNGVAGDTTVEVEPAGWVAEGEANAGAARVEVMEEKAGGGGAAAVNLKLGAAVEKLNVRVVF